MTDRASIFIDALPWDFRSRNTDWRHARYALPQIAKYEPSLHFAVQSSPLISFEGNLKAVCAAIGRRTGFPMSQYRLATSRLSIRDLNRSKAKLVVSHTSFPLNAHHRPVHWIHAIVDPQMQRSYGISESTIAEEISVKLPLFTKAAKVQCFTEVEKRRHVADYPELADRFVAAPHFIPHVTACDLQTLEKHRSSGELRILFVGNNARRKGLAELLEAFLALPLPVQNRAHLTIISNLDRSKITIPSHQKITFLHGAPGARVIEEMKRAHIFVNVAHFESYGLVFMEAMSQGSVCLGPDWEVQRELLDDGRAGVNLRADAIAIRLTLERLIEEPESRYALALAGWRRFQEQYAPAIVARKYREMFLDTIDKYSIR